MRTTLMAIALTLSFSATAFAQCNVQSIDLKKDQAAAQKLAPFLSYGEFYVNAVDYLLIDLQSMYQTLSLQGKVWYVNLKIFS